MEQKEKLIIYQTFPRIHTNTNDTCEPFGSYEKNGSGKLNQIDAKYLKSLSDLGVNTIWLTGIIEMATKTAFPEAGIPADNPNVVKGEAGSPYAIKDYYDVAPAICEDLSNRMGEFTACVGRIHNQGLKVIIDFVPNHTARRYHSDSAPAGVEDFGAADNSGYYFSPSNNYYYIPNQLFSPGFDIRKPGTEPYVEFPAKATGNDCFTAFCGECDWYETVKLNYGHDYGDNTDHFNPIPDTWLKMLNILRFWASKGVDGFRCDMVFMVPQEFWHWAIPQVKKDWPDVMFIGEIYDVGLYRRFLDYCHFDYLYDKVNLYDTLVGIERHNVSTARLTSCWQTVDGIGDSMLNFLENHDEVRFGSPEFAGDPSKVVPHLAVSSMISKGPFMIYYGQELGERGIDNEGFAGDNNRSTIFDYWSYDTMRRWYDGGKCSVRRLSLHERWLRSVYKKILNLCNRRNAIRRGDFFDLMYVNLGNPAVFDPHRQFAFLRYCGNDILLIVANFDNREVKIDINIPDLAFGMAEIAEGEYLSNELIWDKPVEIAIRRGEPLKLSLGSYNAAVIPLKRAESKDSTKTEN